MKKKAGESKPLARIYKSFISPHKIWLIIRIAGAILSAAVDITMAYIIVQIVDNALAADMDNLKRGLTVLLIMVFAGILASFINRYSSGRLGAKTVKSIRTAIGSHTPELKVSYMDTRNSGKEISKLTAAIAGIQNYIENDLPNIIFQPLRFCLCVIKKQ